MIEKLKTVLAALDKSKYTEPTWAEIDQYITDLRSVIAEMEAAEPVAWMAKLGDVECFECIKRDGSIPLFTHPQPKAEPFIKEIVVNADYWEMWAKVVQQNQQLCAALSAQPKAEPKHRTTGWVAPVGRYAVPVLFNPYTGEPRDVRDVQSDPQGILIVPPGKVEMLAAAQPKAEPVQEPVAYVMLDSWLTGKRWPDDCFMDCNNPLDEATPLYTHPKPNQKPLTDFDIWENEEIMSVNSKFQLLMQDLMILVKAIEAAHGIK